MVSVARYIVATLHLRLITAAIEIRCGPEPEARALKADDELAKRCSIQTYDVAD